MKYIALLILFVCPQYMSAQQDSGASVYSVTNKDVQFDLFKVGVTTLNNDNTITLPYYRIEVTHSIIHADFLEKHRNEVINKLVKMLDDPD